MPKEPSLVINASVNAEITPMRSRGWVWPMTLPSGQTTAGVCEAPDEILQDSCQGNANTSTHRVEWHAAFMCTTQQCSKKRINNWVFRRIFATLQKLLPVRLRGPWVENFAVWLPDFLSGPSFCWSNTRQQHSNDKECFPHGPNDWKMPDEFWVNPSTVDSHDQLPSEPVPIDHTLI